MINRLCLPRKWRKKEGTISNLRKVLKDLSEDETGGDMNAHLVAALEEKNLRLQCLEKRNTKVSRELEQKSVEVTRLSSKIVDYDEKANKLNTLEHLSQNSSQQLQKKDDEISSLRKIIIELSDQVMDKAQNGKHILSLIDQAVQSSSFNSDNIHNDINSVLPSDISCESDSVKAAPITTRSSIKPELFLPSRPQGETDSLKDGSQKNRMTTDSNITNYTAILSILKKFQVELKENMKDARQIMQHSPKAYIFLLKIKSTINFVMENIRVISENVEREAERKEADLQFALDQKRTAQQAVTKYISLLDDAKNFVISHSESIQSERVTELEDKVASLQSQLDTRGKVFSETLLEVEQMISKMFNRDFKFNIKHDWKASSSKEI